VSRGGRLGLGRLGAGVLAFHVLVFVASCSSSARTVTATARPAEVREAQRQARELLAGSQRALDLRWSTARGPIPDPCGWRSHERVRFGYLVSASAASVAGSWPLDPIRRHWEQLGRKVESENWTIRTAPADGPAAAARMASGKVELEAWSPCVAGDADDERWLEG
jgi:hypothetical protein